jgi:AraC-like DNA-binding protein
MSRIRLERHRGEQRRIDATQTRAHIERLLGAQWTQAKIARAAGVYHRSIGGILEGQPTVSKRIALAILSIPVGPPPGGDRDVNATGTIRRIRALIAIGYSGAYIAESIGMYPTALNKIARGELSRVRAVTATAVARKYRQLSRTPGPSVRARNDARRNGWYGPAAWDDIDDPDALPETGDATEESIGRRELAVLRRTEIEHLATFNLPEHEIADRLGMSRDYVHDLIRDMGKAA